MGESLTCWADWIVVLSGQWNGIEDFQMEKRVFGKEHSSGATQDNV